MAGVLKAGPADVLPVWKFLLISRQGSLFVDWLEENVRSLHKTVSWPVDHRGRVKRTVQGDIRALEV